VHPEVGDGLLGGCGGVMYSDGVSMFPDDLLRSDKMLYFIRAMFLVTVISSSSSIGWVML
jgi:hypothetical protein